MEPVLGQDILQGVGGPVSHGQRAPVHPTKGVVHDQPDNLHKPLQLSIPGPIGQRDHLVHGCPPMQSLPSGPRHQPVNPPSKGIEGHMPGRRALCLAGQRLVDVQQGAAEFEQGLVEAGVFYEEVQVGLEGWVQERVGGLRVGQRLGAQGGEVLVHP